MMKMFKVFLPLTLLTGLLFSQSIEANWQLGAAIVEYTYVVRDSASAEDATAVYDVTGSWPSSAAAAAGAAAAARPTSGQPADSWARASTWCSWLSRCSSGSRSPARMLGRAKRSTLIRPSALTRR